MSHPTAVSNSQTQGPRASQPKTTSVLTRTRHSRWKWSRRTCRIRKHMEQFFSWTASASTGRRHSGESHRSLDTRKGQDSTQSSSLVCPTSETNAKLNLVTLSNNAWEIAAPATWEKLNAISKRSTRERQARSLLSSMQQRSSREGWRFLTEFTEKSTQSSKSCRISQKRTSVTRFA